MLSLFNPQLKSALTPERIDLINHLAKQANVTARHNESNNLNIHDLIIETEAMKGVLEVVSETGWSSEFFENIDAAFLTLIKQSPDKAPGIFETYQQLTGMFRVIEADREIITQKWEESVQLMEDIDTLDKEDRDRRKGRKGEVSC